MKKAKKFLSLVLVALMCLSTVLFNVNATETEEALAPTGQCGDNVYWTLDKTAGEIIISGEGDMWNYNSTTSPFGSKDIKSIIIEEGITSIGNYAFEYSLNLSSIKIPDSVTSIGADAFHNATNLMDIYISNISSWCSIKFTNIFSNPLCIAENLYLNENLVEDIIVPNEVEQINDFAFLNYCKLKSINIPASVTNIGSNAFWNCKNLEEIIIPDNVTSIGDNAFFSCSNLKKAIIGKSVISIGDYAFAACTSLEEIIIPDNVTSIGHNAFFSCSNFKKAIIGKSVTSIGDYAFAECTCLTIYGYNPSTAKSYAEANDIPFKAINIITDEPSTPDTPSDPTDNCSCNCHAGGVKTFFFKLINFFQKLFGKNKVCACGIKH